MVCLNFRLSPLLKKKGLYSASWDLRKTFTTIKITQEISDVTPNTSQLKAKSCSQLNEFKNLDLWFVQKPSNGN